MKVVEQFKRRILDLAIRGKLVPQDPNDEPASILLERIKAEKGNLLKPARSRRRRTPLRSSSVLMGRPMRSSARGIYLTRRRGDAERDGARFHAP